MLSSLFPRRRSNPVKSTFGPISCSCIDVTAEAAAVVASTRVEQEVPESQIPAVAKKHLASVPGVTYVNTPPIPVGGDGDPILLPNERLLQRFPNKRSMFKVSEYKVQYARQKCLKCSTNLTSSDPWAKNSSASQNPDQSVRESSLEYLSGGAQAGTAFVTTERIIFVPKQMNLVGFSLEIEDITAMKILESDTIVDSWFFVAYVDNSVCTIPFVSEIRSQQFMNLIANLQFEHKIRRCLPPRDPAKKRLSASAGSANTNSNSSNSNLPVPTTGNITPSNSNNNTTNQLTTASANNNTATSPDKQRKSHTNRPKPVKKPSYSASPWDEEDKRLPSYDESEHALQRLMVSKGLLDVNQPLDRDTDTNLIALASAPPTDPNDREREELQAQQDLNHLHSTIPQALMSHVNSISR